MSTHDDPCVAISPNIASSVGRALRSLAILGSGRVLARLAMVAALPLLARRYDAEAFGLFGAFSMVCTALTGAAAICYEQGIVPAKTNAEATRLTYLSLLLIGLTFIGLLIPLALLGPVFLSHLAGPAPALTLFLLPLGVAFNAAVLVLLQLANRGRRDRAITCASVLRAGGMIAIQFGASWLAIGPYGLIFGQIAGSALAAVSLWMILPWSRLPADEGRWLQQLWDTARRLSALPMLGAPRVLLEAGGTVLAISLMTQLFGAAEVGLFWMAQRVVTLPSQLIDEPVSQLFYRSASTSLARGDGVKGPLLTTLLGLAAVALPFVLVLHLGADTLFAWILGPNWAAAADYAKIMSVGWLAAQVALPLHLLPVLVGGLKLHFVFEVGMQATRVAVILVAHAIGSFTLCLILLAVQEALYHLGWGCALYWRTSAGRRREGRARLV